MSSFYAELTVAGGTYPVRRCEFAFTQATDARGRVQAKVRHGLLYLVLDVPATDQLLAWAQAAYKPLAGHVTFFETNRRSARETVSFAAGQCVGYEELFEVGDGGAGAYVCQLTITTTGLVLVPGGPAGAFVAPAAREHGAPVESNKPIVVSTQVAYRKNIADPIRDVLGPGRVSHPDEWQSTLANLKSAGVEIMLTSEERLAYAPGTRPGNPGQIHLHENASIGALRHEYQHFLDDQAAGFLGTRGLYDLAFRKQTEQKAYSLEIAMMEDMGEQEAAAQLRQNLRDELARLEVDLGEIVID